MPNKNHLLAVNIKHELRLSHETCVVTIAFFEFFGRYTPVVGHGSEIVRIVAKVAESLNQESQHIGRFLVKLSFTQKIATMKTRNRSDADSGRIRKAIFSEDHMFEPHTGKGITVFVRVEKKVNMFGWNMFLCLLCQSVFHFCCFVLYCLRFLQISNLHGVNPYASANPIWFSVTLKNFECARRQPRNQDYRVLGFKAFVAHCQTHLFLVVALL
mmetsp:Transcript_23963/g.67119  ORF Transcript_23963/g.67119 Transcript_23963/m.67119 type:complete len:214 (-) Transcript_23963:735-1376(-)